MSYPASEAFALDARATKTTIRVYRFLYGHVPLGAIVPCKSEWVGVGAGLVRQKAHAALRLLIQWGYVIEHAPLIEPGQQGKPPLRVEMAYAVDGTERPCVADPAALVDQRLTPRTRKVYAWICPRLAFHEPREFRTWYVAELCGVHRPDVSKALTRLVRLGYLIEHPRDATQGRLFSLPIAHQQLRAA